MSPVARSTVNAKSRSAGSILGLLSLHFLKRTLKFGLRVLLPCNRPWPRWSRHPRLAAVPAYWLGARRLWLRFRWWRVPGRAREAVVVAGQLEHVLGEPEAQLTVT